jgi:hypothetical protein
LPFAGTGAGSAAADPAGFAFTGSDAADFAVTGSDADPDAAAALSFAGTGAGSEAAAAGFASTGSGADSQAAAVALPLAGSDDDAAEAETEADAAGLLFAASAVGATAGAPARFERLFVDRLPLIRSCVTRIPRRRIDGL